MNAYMNQYQSTQVQTASPEQILIMLYDGAIRFSRQATEFMLAGQMTAKAEKISRVIAIVSELANTLDHEIGGEIAEELDALYNFMIRELTQANLQNDADKLTVVENLLSDLRETWMQAIEINRQERAPAPAPAAEYKPFQAAL